MFQNKTIFTVNLVFLKVLIAAIALVLYYKAYRMTWIPILIIILGLSWHFLNSYGRTLDQQVNNIKKLCVRFFKQEENKNERTR